MIGKTIKSILVNNAPLMALVPATKVFPYIVNEETSIPAIIYVIESVTPTYNKGGWANDEIVFSVSSSAASYDLLQPIVSAIRTAFEGNQTGTGTQDINRIYLTGFEEAAINSPEISGYFNKLTFKVTINTY